MNKKMLSITKKLERFPHIAARVEALFDIAENTYGDCKLANDAERKIIEELNKMGQEMLAAWGKEQETKKRKVYEEDIKFIKHNKKKHGG
jgi:hypothetical protein